MQFVFGDNTSKYTMLYFDDKADAAEKAQGLVQMSYSPNPDYDSVGFVPFGANNTRALFFKFCKDFKMKRNVYFLHGVYGDVDPEYFYGDSYVGGLFTEFLNQEKFDVLRDQVLAGEKCDVPYGYHKELAAVPYDQIPIERADLHEILTKLYQRKGVVLVMDDDKFSEQRALLTVKLIFRYLTPSLRKLCSYVTAVDDTGEMNFMIRIIPRCMLKLKEEYVDLDNRDPLYKDKTNFSSIALQLMAMDDKERQEVFDLYEKLYYGRDSIYKKQNFERFYLCYTSTGEDVESLKLCDELLTDYLDNPKRAKEPEIPVFLRDALTARYTSAQVLDSLVDWNPRNLDHVDQFCDANADVLRKVYYLADRNLTYFRDKISNLYCRAYSYKEMGDLRKAYNAMCNSGKAMKDVEPCEEVLLHIVVNVLKKVKELLDYFKDAKELVTHSANDYLQQNCKRGANEPRAVVEYAMSKVVDEVKRLEAVVPDVDENLRRYIVEEIVTPHNSECNRIAREERDVRDKSMKNNIYTAFVYRLKLDGVEAVDPEDTDEAQQMAIDMDSLDIDPMGLTADDLNRVAEDEELAPQLAQKMADYISKVCATRERSDFNPFRNENLKLVSNLKLCFQVAGLLCRNDEADLAVLYLLAYCPALDAAMNFILKKMPELDEVSKQGLQNMKKVVPAQLKKRRRTDALEPEDVEMLAHKAQGILDDKSVSKPLKVMATMVADWANDRPPILVRERKRNLIAAICIGAGALVLIGVLALVIILGGNKDDDNASATEAPQATTAATEPQEKPCEHNYEVTGTKVATCTSTGEKTKVCTLCGDSQNEVIPMLEHTWTEVTCSTAKTCSVCGASEGEPNFSHNFTPTSTAEPGSCVDGGVNVFTCTECGSLKEVTAHKWSDGICESCNEACEDHNWTEGVCSICGTKEQADEPTEE